MGAGPSPVPGRRLRACGLALLAWSCVAGAARAQPPADRAGAAAWTAEAVVSLYLIEDDDPLVMPVVSFDRGALHVEGRYQYEDRDTISVWAGWTFEVGRAVHLTMVPMAGLVLGNATGVAPGGEITLAWRRIEFYNESEYMFDTTGDAGHFAYTWSELGVSATDWLRFGLSVQRMREHRSARWIDRGVFAAVSAGRVDASFHWFNVEEGDRFAILGVSVAF